MDASVYRRIDDLKYIIGDVNESPSLVDEKHVAFVRFAGLAGLDVGEHGPDNILEGDWEKIDKEGTIDIFAFRADMIQRGYDAHWADATFRAFDITHDGGINKYEYFLGILISTKSSKLNCFIDEKWITFRCKLLYSFFCRHDGSIGRSELENMAHECHIAIDIDKIIPSDAEPPQLWRCTTREFRDIVMTNDIDVVHALNVCNTRRPHPRTASRRVTLDSRLITTENTAITLKTHVSTTVPSLGRAPGLVVEPDLAPTYDWPQNIIFDRTSVAHKIATFVLQQTIGLVHLQLASESVDVPSKFHHYRKPTQCK
jgi:hypothetical protein